ncbi:hypothetical protein NC651_022025 [Populus alba x Populus x berolinensis]|nr:hypothetical protein NC651_022025 [Populus alba x Populus x berolinensis]
MKLPEFSPPPFNFLLRRHKEEQRREDGNDPKLLQQPITRHHLRPVLFSRSIQGLPFPFISPHPSREFSFRQHTRIDWKETAEAHVFKADLPGIKKEEVKVEIEDDRVLQISGERNVEKEDRNDTWHRVERSSGKFLRRFKLPENAKTDQVKAGMENGVLTVTVPKEEVKKPDARKTIEISC